MWGALIAALAAALAGVSGFALATGPVGQPMGLCAYQLRVDGVPYDGVRPPDRVPELTGRTTTAVLPGCNDTGETQDPPDVEVVVEEIAGIPMSVAVWSGGGVAVRRGEELPDSTESWYGTPPCSLRDPVTLTGRWLGVMTEKEPRFDGDLRAPLWIDLAVEPGQDNPPALVGYTLRIHDDGAAAPALDKPMAQDALWSSRALLAVEVSCAGDRYTARGFALRP